MMCDCDLSDCTSDPKSEGVHLWRMKALSPVHRFDAQRTRLGYGPKDYDSIVSPPAWNKRSIVILK